MSDNAPITNAIYSPIEYGWQDDFVPKPAEGAIVRDCTESTLIVDLENSLGETFHFEIPPDSTRDRSGGQKTDNPALGGKTFVLLLFPA